MNEKFHLILYEATGNQRIVKIISNLMVETSSYVRLAVIVEGQKSRAKSYHQKILEAVKKRDGEKAEALTQEHLHLTEQTVIEYLIKTRAT
jgi:DNA-binding GntR family transcriptional regulator